MPTPTPVPPSQVVQAIQAVQNTVDSATQQGAITIVVILAFALLVFAIGYTLSVVINRNKKPDNAGINSLIESQSETLEALRSEFRQERAEWRKLIEKRDESFTEAVSHLGDSHNRMVDVQDKQIKLETSINDERRAATETINAVKADVSQMLSVGSVPLRKLIENVDGYSKGIIEKVDRIEALVNEMKTHLLPCPEIQILSDKDRKLLTDVLEAVQADMELVNSSMQNRIEEKRKTDTGNMKPIVAPNEPALTLAPEAN